MKVLILILGFITTSVEALWNEQHEEGWHWYQDPKKEIEREKKNQTQTSTLNDPLEEIAKERETLDRLRAEAVLRPTGLAVKAYIEKQVWATNQADRFSQVWDAVMRQHPELDYAVTHPTAQFARHIYLDQQKLQVKEAIENFKQDYGFLFFFKSDCEYCRAMAPIIQEVSTRHGITVSAISLNGGTLAEYAQVLLDNGISKKMGVMSVPAVFAVNPNKDEWFPIVTGPISATDLEERIWAIANYMAYEKEVDHHVATHHP